MFFHVQGSSPSQDGTTLSTEQAPEGVPFPGIAVGRPEEFGPGLDPDLMELVQATAEMEGNETTAPLWGPADGQRSGTFGRIKEKLTP